ncbi:unnamed protein product [Orchesella dallaii]|uniref:Uncharacterized protein n=1 Tax=Orchesella dallaii TaxID=48710 RepID=A0ABP1PKA5_9HEXA
MEFHHKKIKIVLNISILCFLIAVVSKTEAYALKNRPSHPAPRVSRLEEVSYSTVSTGISPRYESDSETFKINEEQGNHQLSSITRFKRGIAGIYNNGNKPSVYSSPVASGISPWGRPLRVSSNGNKPPRFGLSRGNVTSDADSTQAISDSQIAFASSPTEFPSSPSPTNKNPLFAALAMAAITGALRSTMKNDQEDQNYQLPTKKSLFDLDSSSNSSLRIFSSNLDSTSSKSEKGNFGIQNQAEFDTKSTPAARINTWENDNCYFCKTIQIQPMGGTPSTMKRTGVTSSGRNNDGINNFFTTLYNPTVPVPTLKGGLKDSTPLSTNNDKGLLTPISSLGFGTPYEYSTVKPLVLNDNSNWPITRISSSTNLDTTSRCTREFLFNQRIPIQPIIGNDNNKFPASSFDLTYLSSPKDSYQPNLLNVRKKRL